MSDYIVTLSPKGQITIPIAERSKFRSNKYLLQVSSKTFTLKPVSFKVEGENDDMEGFEKLSEKSFDFWNNSSDDIYQNFYENKTK